MIPQEFECRTHLSVLRVDGRVRAVLVQMGGVTHHWRIDRLNHGPGRAPWIRGMVHALY